MCQKGLIFKKSMGDLYARDYELIPIQMGCEVRGIDLKTDIKPQVISQIKDDLIKHRLLLFKNQNLSSDRHVKLSSYFGKVDSDLEKHPQSPHPCILRISDNAENGISGVWNDEWHIDGTGDIPFLYSFYHAIKVENVNQIHFSPIDEIVENLDESKKNEWDSLWVDFHGNVLPLVIRHPLSRNPTLCLNPSMTSGLISSFGTDQETRLSSHSKVINNILNEIAQNSSYKHQWEEGDFLMVDNLALAHKIPKYDQNCSIILHRVSVKDDSKPGK